MVARIWRRSWSRKRSRRRSRRRSRERSRRRSRRRRASMRNMGRIVIDFSLVTEIDVLVLMKASIWDADFLSQQTNDLIPFPTV